MISTYKMLWTQVTIAIFKYKIFNDRGLAQYRLKLLINCTILIWSKRCKPVLVCVLCDDREKIHAVAKNLRRCIFSIFYRRSIFSTRRFVKDFERYSSSTTLKFIRTFPIIVLKLPLPGVANPLCILPNTLSTTPRQLKPQIITSCQRRMIINAPMLKILYMLTIKM